MLFIFYDFILFIIFIYKQDTTAESTKPQRFEHQPRLSNKHVDHIKRGIATCWHMHTEHPSYVLVDARKVSITAYGSRVWQAYGSHICLPCKAAMCGCYICLPGMAAIKACCHVKLQAYMGPIHGPDMGPIYGPYI